MMTELYTFAISVDSFSTDILSLSEMSCGTGTDYVDFCLLPTDCVLSHFLPIPITFIPMIRSGTISEHVCSSTLLWDAEITPLRWE